MNILFFLFPFILFLGIAAQAAAFYLIALIIPFGYFLYHKKKLQPYFAKIGACLALLFIIFPIINFIVYFFPHRKMPPNFYTITWEWPGIFESNFPSSLFIGGIFLIVLYFLANKKNAINNYEIAQFQPLKFFLMGLAPASLLYLMALFVTYYTNFDYHSIFNRSVHTAFLPVVPGVHYRVSGLYGNPLTVAAACLGYAVFAWTLLWSFIKNRNTFTWQYIPFHNYKYIPYILLNIIAFSNLICIFLTGGRSAGFCGIVLFFIIPFFYGWRKKLYLSSLVTLCFFSGMLLSAKKFDVFNRLETTHLQFEKKTFINTHDNRHYFWLIYSYMYRDKPIIGQGRYWLRKGIREDFYQKEGYGWLTERYFAHNWYLEILGSGGTLSFLWILGLLIYLFRILKRNLFEKSNNLYPISLCFIMAFIANLMHSMTQNVYFDSSVVYIYICLIFVCMWENAARQKSTN